jgi:stage II sporulation protein GA (sporulation sigma-E factor processing peptidase)
MQVVYIDTVFFINFSVNFLMLLAAAKFSGFPYRRLRLLASAMFGGLYGVLACVPGLKILSSLGIKLAVGATMVFIGFGFVNLKRYIKYLMLFILVSVVFGGDVFAIYITGGGDIKDFGSNLLYSRISPNVLIISVLLCYGFISIFFSGVGRHGGSCGDITQIEASMGDRKITISALVDTGNTLQDPISRAAVMVAEVDAVKDIFPPGIQGLFDRSLVSDPQALMIISEVDSALARRFRLIPFKSVGLEGGILLAFRPDSVLVSGRVQKGMLIALSPNDLSEGAGYSALVGSLG